MIRGFYLRLTALIYDPVRGEEEELLGLEVTKLTVTF